MTRCPRCGGNLLRERLVDARDGEGLKCGWSGVTRPPAADEMSGKGVAYHPRGLR